MAKNVITTVKATVGESVYTKLLEFYKKPEMLEKVADRVISYHEKMKDFDLKKNLMINLVKFAVATNNWPPANRTGKVEEFIKSLGITAAERASIYEALFDKEGLKKAGIQIFR